MDTKRLNAGGWIAVISMILVFVELATVLVTKHWPVLPAFLLSLPINLAQLYLSVFLLRTWKILLTRAYGFSEADSILDTLTMLVIVLCMLGIINAAAKGLEPIDVVIGVLAVAFAVVTIVARLVFARILLRLPDDLSGLKQTFCFLVMAECICWFSIILIPLGLLLSVAISIVNAMIFFQTANRFDAARRFNCQQQLRETLNSEGANS